MSPTGQEMTTSGHLARIMQKGEFVVGTTGNMPPLNMTAKDGEVIGFEMDMVRMMAAALGAELKVKTMAFHELLPALELNKVDIVISGMTITPVRNLRFAFVGPYFSSGKAFLAKSETIANVSDAAKINSPSMPANDPHFINWVENFLGILEGSGKMEHLKNKWFGSGGWVDRVW